MAKFFKEDLGKNPRLTLSLQIDHPCGGQTIHPPMIDLFEVLKDEDAYVAQYFGVMTSHYLAWKQFLSDPRCMGEAKTGKPCQATIPQSELPDTPDQFRPNFGYYCNKHDGRE